MVLFLICCILGIIVLVFRRICVGGELGGSTCGRYFSALIFILLWVFYIVVSTLNIYGVIDLNF